MNKWLVMFILVAQAHSVRSKFSTNYSSRELSAWDAVHANEGRMNFVDGFLEVTVLPGDQINTSKGRERSELLKRTGEGEGIRSNWRWKVQIPEGFSFGGSAWVVFSQWHHDGKKCASPLALGIREANGKPVIYLGVNGGLLDERRCTSTYRVSRDIFSPELGRTYEVEADIHWSSSRGSTVIRIDGRELVRLDAPNLYSGQGVYFKQGLYREHGTTATRIRLGDVNFRVIE